MSDFMQHQVTGKQTWLRVETTIGTEFLPADIVGFVRNSDCLSQPLTPDEHWKYVTKIQEYTEGEPQEWENIKGYGARLSAPGYLDATDWTVFERAKCTECLSPLEWEYILGMRFHAECCGHRYVMHPETVRIEQD